MAVRQRRPIKQQRYGAQKKKKKTGLGIRKKLVILSLGFVLLLGGLTVGGLIAVKGMGQSDFFQITATKIQGCRRTTKNMILELSGVDIHTNLMALKPAEVSARIATHEWVESVEIEKHWPNHLTIKVKERVPVAIVNLKDGLYYLDQHGVAFVRVLPPEDMDYPVISGLNNENWPAQVKGSALDDALYFIKYARRGSSILPKQNISELHLNGEKNITLFLANRPFAVELGRGKMRTKYYRLAKVLYHLYKRKEFEKTAYIDMNYQRDKVLVGFSGTG